MALEFLENVEKVKLVNIDSTHLVDGKLKLILGLIWKLILHYSTSIPMKERAKENHARSYKSTNKKNLFIWAKSKLPSKFQIQNFNSDWNNGSAIAALDDSYADGFYHNWQTIDPKA
jgi:filamin